MAKLPAASGCALTVTASEESYRNLSSVLSHCLLCVLHAQIFMVDDENEYMYMHHGHVANVVGYTVPKVHDRLCELNYY